jgi:hypothetical protein
MELEQAVKENGFSSVEEFHTLVDRVDFSKNPLVLSKFKNWQFKDGTKEGLLNLLKEIKI